MRPLRLTMTAFGPYKETETIDFAKLNGHHLFVISGATGAGKTTIFDGICFALYGSASGADRENMMMLRSHFADDDVHTAVEFTFEVRRRTFRVLRQLGHIKAGNKSKTGDKYEFYEITDSGEVPFVDRQIVSEINARMEALIGLTEDQFKQIVMLPQGEFRKLLTSETENKEEILRRLFKTERYKKMNQRLKEKKDAVQARHLQVEQQINHFIQSIPNALTPREGETVFAVLEKDHFNTVQILDGLKAEIAYYAEKIETDYETYEKSLASFESKQTYFHQVVYVNQRFDLFKEKKKAFQELTDQKAWFATKEQQLKAARKAMMIIGFERQMKERKTEEQQLHKRLKKAEEDFSAVEKALKKAQTLYQQEQEKQPLREKTKETLNQYETFLPIVKEIEEQKVSLTKLHDAMKRRATAIEEKKKLQNDDKTQLQKLKETIEEQAKKAEELPKQQMKREQLLNQYKRLKEYLTSVQAMDDNKKQLVQHEKAYLDMEKKYRQAESNWMGQQAAVLASHLEDGCACPVCGSTAHPEKATAESSIIEKEELDRFRGELEKVQKTYQTSREEVHGYQKHVNHLARQLIDDGLNPANGATELEQITEKGKRLKESICLLEQVNDQLKKNRAHVTQLETKTETFQQEITKLETVYYQNQSDFSAQKATFKERISQVPEALRDLPTLEEKRKQMAIESKSLEETWEKAQQQLKEKETAYTEAKAHVANHKDQVSNIAEKVQTAVTQFEEQWKGAGFDSADAYHEAKLPQETVDRLEAEINAYDENVHALEKQVTELEFELKDKERTDTEQVKAELDTLKTTYEKAFGAWNESKNQYRSAEHLFKNIQAGMEEEKTLEAELAIITDLHDMLRGQNEKRISFERYLQIDYLEQIIDAANERFRQLMNGQFYLLRSERQETHGRQSGLAIDVYDVYTGQTRDVKTLSGGEKFIASLCLALGMSDVIQGEQGSISMDTMFIDEGFGSLDEESLHKSIDALIELQQTGRMIGVISHVEELKTIFPAMLEVKKTKEGHSKTAFVLK